jgi:hypothetical protein
VASAASAVAMAPIATQSTPLSLKALTGSVLPLRKSRSSCRTPSRSPIPRDPILPSFTFAVETDEDAKEGHDREQWHHRHRGEDQVQGAFGRVIATTTRGDTRFRPGPAEFHSNPKSNAPRSAKRLIFPTLRELNSCAGAVPLKGSAARPAGPPPGQEA